MSDDVEVDTAESDVVSDGDDKRGVPDSEPDQPCRPT